MTKPKTHPSFSKQHYKAIAAAIKATRLKDYQYKFISTDKLVSMLSYYFSIDNSRFNEQAFRIACGEEIKESSDV